MQTLNFIVVYLAPVIPALGSYYLVKSRLGRHYAEVGGTLYGFSIKLGGFAGTYAAFLLIAFFISHNFMEPPERQVRVVLTLVGEQRLAEMLLNKVDSLILQLRPVSVGARELRFDRFAVQPGARLMTAVAKLPKSDLGQIYTVDVRPELGGIRYSSTVLG